MNEPIPEHAGELVRSNRRARRRRCHGRIRLGRGRQGRRRGPRLLPFRFGSPVEEP